MEMPTISSCSCSYYYYYCHSTNHEGANLPFRSFSSSFTYRDRGIYGKIEKKIHIVPYECDSRVAFFKFFTQAQDNRMTFIQVHLTHMSKI